MPPITTRSRRSRNRMLAMVLGLAVAFVASDAMAQSRGRSGGSRGPSRGPSIGRTLLNRQNSGFRTGLQGVKAQLPRPLANRGSLLPPSKGHTHSHRGSVTGSRAGVGRGNFDRNGRSGAVRGDDRFRLGFDSRSGFRLSGAVGDRDDDFRLRFRLNPGGVGVGRDHWRDRVKHGHGHDHHHHHDHFPTTILPWWGWGWGWDYYDRYDYNPPQTIVSQPIYIDPALLQPGAQQQQQQPATPPTPPTPLERAQIALYYGETDAAIAAFREHLEKTPEDAEAMRSLAVALVKDKKVKEAVALIGLAYEKDISLVRKPIDMPLVSESPEDFREILRRVVPFANRIKSASGYVAVIALMQAEGRNALALKILAKAKAVGLDEKLATEFENELSR